MKKLIITALAGVALITGCATKTTVNEVAPNHYLVCDQAGGHEPGGSDPNCDGPNPKKGLLDVCLPDGLVINDVTKLPQGGLAVTCGPAR